jgi:hypothetical protein
MASALEERELRHGLGLLHYNIGEAAGHNDTQNSVSDVYITSITAWWKAAKQECNDKSALP